MSRCAVYIQRHQLTHDKGSAVLLEIICQIRTVRRDPLVGHFSLHICDSVVLVSAWTALVRIVAVSVQCDHHAGLAFVRGNHSVMAYLKRFVDICQGSNVCSGSLQCRELDRPCLKTRITAVPDICLWPNASTATSLPSSHTNLPSAI